jgi:methyl-accepting chemotaxis protein
MSWFNNLRMFSKLILSFSVILVLTVALGVFAVSQLARVNDTSTVMEVHWMPAVKIAGELASLCSYYRRNEMQHVLSTDESGMVSYEKSMDEAEAKIEKNAAELNRLSPEPRSSGSWPTSRPPGRTIARSHRSS